MLKLKTDVINAYNQSIDAVDISDMVTVHEVIDNYSNLFEKTGMSKSESTALDIIVKNVSDVVDETFDYRDEDFDISIHCMGESLNRLPRCSMTEPLFSLYEKSLWASDDNNLLTTSQNIKSSSECPVDFVLYKMYSEGFIPQQDMDTYKVSLETEVYGLVNSLKLIDDMRMDDTTVPTKSQNRNTEIIHPNFIMISNIFDDYIANWLNNSDDNDVYNYTCTPNAIIDKVYLCDINFHGIEGIDTTNPIQVKMCQQVSALMYTMHTYLEKLVLQNYNSEISAGLYKLAVKLVALLEAAPSITAAVLTKLVICCLIDSIHLGGGELERPLSANRTLRSLVDRVNWVYLSMDEDFRNSPKCLLNFQYLCDIVIRDCSLNETDIDDVVNESMELLTNPSNDYSCITNVRSSTLEMHETSMSSLAEMFQVMSDGTIKVSIEEKTTYMNEYAMNHRLLKYNNQQRDYEAMKYNIVYHMILIDSIEKNVLYNKKVKKDSDLYKDAEQARRMAKSDIATYLPVIRQNTPSFNLNDMYKKVKADKATITIQGADTASGIKTILKHILY